MEKSDVKISRRLMLMMTVADANQNGYVEYDEREKVLRSNNDGSGGVMEDVFKAMDDGSDGKVGYEDVRSYLLSAGFEVNDDEIKAMVRLGGVDDDAEKNLGFHVYRLCSFPLFCRTYSNYTYFSVENLELAIEFDISSKKKPPASMNLDEKPHMFLLH